MARSRVYRFGPGRLEDCEIRLWARPRTDGRVIVAELRGTLVVYCGNGTVHYPRVQWRVEITRGDDARTRARYGDAIADTSTDCMLDRLYSSSDEDLAYQLGYALESEALEDWRDPCEDECAECDAPAVIFGDGEYDRFCRAHAPADLLEDDD